MNDKEQINPMPNDSSNDTNSLNNNKESKGPTIGIVIIILILILGAVYIFTNRHDNNTIPEDEVTEETLLNQSDSTDLETIEADALNTDLGDIDRELLDIESELETI